MPLTEADICSLALFRIGQGEGITDPLGDDPSAAGAACRLIYPRHRNQLLARFAWPWATRTATLYPSTPADALALPGWAFAYAVPADILHAQYIYGGARPGQGFAPLPSGCFPRSSPDMPLINGRIPQIPFRQHGGYVFTDWSEDLPAWDVGTTYAVGAVVTRNGSSWSAVQASTGVDPSTDDGTNWAASTTTERARLVYTAQITDVTLFPDLFVEALAWRLAVDLALSQAAKPQLAQVLEQQAELAVRRAVAEQANAGAPDPEPASPYIAARGS